jgi:hypothetical protein
MSTEYRIALMCLGAAAGLVLAIPVIYVANYFIARHFYLKAKR